MQVESLGTITSGSRGFPLGYYYSLYDTNNLLEFESFKKYQLTSIVLCSVLVRVEWRTFEMSNSDLVCLYDYYYIFMPKDTLKLLIFLSYGCISGICCLGYGIIKSLILFSSLDKLSYSSVDILIKLFHPRNCLNFYFICSFNLLFLKLY